MGMIKDTDGELWYHSPSGYRQTLASHNRKNNRRMFVDGEYIPKSHPLWKAGRYKSFNEAAFSSLENFTSTNEGFVYVITNKAWPEWVKIGMAIDAEDRLKGYQTSSPMRDFELKFFAPFKDRRKAETFAHNECKKLGVEQNGEWFKMSVDTAKKIIGDLHGAS
jgi:hypothetical protein